MLPKYSSLSPPLPTNLPVVSSASSDSFVPRTVFLNAQLELKRIESFYEKKSQHKATGKEKATKIHTSLCIRVENFP